MSNLNQMVLFSRPPELWPFRVSALRKKNSGVIFQAFWIKISPVYFLLFKRDKRNIIQRLVFTVTREQKTVFR